MLSRKASRATAAIKQHTSTRNLHLLDEKFKQKQNVEQRSTKRPRSPRKKNTTERQDRKNTGFQTKSVQKSSEIQQISPRKKTRHTTENQGRKIRVVETKSEPKSSQIEPRATRRKSSTEKPETSTERRKTGTGRRDTKTERRKTSTERRETSTERRETSTERRETSTERRDTKTERRKTITERRETSTERRETSTERRETSTERRKTDAERRKTSTERQGRENSDVRLRKSSPRKERSPSKKRTKPKRKSERTNLSIQSHIARLSGGMRDGIVDKTKLCEERTNHPQNKNGEKSRRNRKGEERKISECTSQNGSLAKQSESAKEDVSKLDLAELGDTTTSIDTGMADTARDDISAKPDSSRSLTESEYCYSSDPDWDTSVSSETSSGNLSARNLCAIMQHNPTPDNRHGGREGMNTGMGSPFRSEYDQSPTESVMSCTSSSSDDESLAETEHISNKGDAPMKVKEEPKRSFTKAKDGKRAKIGLGMNAKDEKPKYASKVGKYVRAKNPDVDKRASEIPVRPRAAKQSRRVQSESVVRGSRSKKKRSSPSKRGTADRNKERDGRMSRYVKASRVDGRAIVKDRGKGRPSVDVEVKYATKQGNNTELDNKLNIGDQKANESEHESDESLNGEEKASTAGNDEAEYSMGGKTSVNGEESKSTMSNGETECTVERKPSVRFSLPKREDWKYYRSSEDISMSSLSSDDAMMCDGYSDSSSLSSLISDEIWDSDSGDEGVRQDRRRFIKTRNADGTLKGGDQDRKRFVKRADEKPNGGDRDSSRFVETRSVPVEHQRGDGQAPRAQRDGQNYYKGQQKSPKKKDVSARKTDVLKGKQASHSDIKQSEKRRLVKAKSEMTTTVTKKYSTKLARCKSANLDRPNDVNARNVPNKLRMYITPVSSHPRSEKELIKYTELQAKARSLKPQGRQTSKVGNVSGKPTGEVIMRQKGDSKDHEKPTNTTHTQNKVMTRKKPTDSVMKGASPPTPDVPRQSRNVTKEPREPLRRRSSDLSSHDQMLKKRSRLTTVSLKT